MEKKVSPSTQPCGTPDVTFTGLDHAVPRTTCYGRLVMYSMIVPSILGCSLRASRFLKRISSLRETLSKALVKSKNYSLLDIPNIILHLFKNVNILKFLDLKRLQT